MPEKKEERYEDALDELKDIAREFYDQIEEGEVPNMKIPTRSKSNIELDRREGVWKLGDSKTKRSAKKLKSARMLLRTLYMLELIQDMIEEGKSSTLREMYYISEGWDKAEFSKQSESDSLAEDMELVTGCLREDFKLRPEEDGARLIGDITVEEVNRKGDVRKINCRDDVGDSGYTIPYNVEADKVSFSDINVDFMIAIETGGMFDRLVENGFDETANALLVHLKGQPARATRRVIKRLSEEEDVPVVVFTDADPWSFRIFASVAYGAINTAYLSDFLATPTAEYIGITASDIMTYDLPTDNLSKNDRKALEQELEDPRFDTDFWKEEIETMLDINKKAEQQALAKYGLDYVTDTYLPEKLEQVGLM
ncbi:MAG: DNA topoisomerase IV subunit A [Candidatus Thermoplasmatota archaeon]